MNIINLTPHSITLRNETGDTVVESSGVARVATTPGAKLEGNMAPCELWTPTTFGEVEGLPERQPETIYVVSAMVAARVKRLDVFAPGTGPQDNAIRNEKGQIVAVTRLICSV